MRKFKLSWLFILLGMFIPALTVYGTSEPQTFHLTVLHTNDLHGRHLGDLAREATLIKQTRAKEANVLVLNAGDVSDRRSGSLGDMEFAVLNALGIDALTLGNNEFKATDDLMAQKYLYARINQAKFPVLCANVVVAKNGSYLPNVKPYTVITRKGIKIGIIGISTKEIGEYEQAKGFAVLKQIDTAKKIYSKVAAQTDIVLALTHIGFKHDRALAKEVPGLAAIVGGHSHTLLMEPKLVGNVPIVQAGKYGEYMGRLDLYFERGSRGWVLKRYNGQLILLDKSIKKDPEIKALVDRYQARVFKTK